MNKNYIILIAIAILLTVSNAEIHAVLVAGSNGFGNYRHQADICHAYHILINNGVKAQNIIVMAYNDIAHNVRNPFQGTIFNKPSGMGQSSENVYPGCVIDYEGNDVTPENYLAILKGDKQAVQNAGNGRVLSSGPNDEVFLNFSDHGAAGLIAFPSEYLYADQLNEAFQYMSQNKMYKQLTYYLEACYSGTMFQQTPTNINIYAVSAANTQQSSYATYCPPNDDMVSGTHMGTCLGDLFSVNWMQNTEAANLNSETLQQQFETVKKDTAPSAFSSAGSEVLQWGDVSFTNESIGTFLGNKPTLNYGFFSKVYQSFRNLRKVNSLNTKQGAIPSDKATFNYLLDQYNKHPNEENYEALSRDLKTTNNFNRIFKQFNKIYNQENTFVSETNFTCYRFLIEKLENYYGKVNDASLPLLRNFYNYCGTISQPQEEIETLVKFEILLD